MKNGIELFVSALAWILLGCAGEESFTVHSDDGPTREELAAEYATDVGRLTVTLTGLTCPKNDTTIAVRLNVASEKSVRFVPCNRPVVTVAALPLGQAYDIYFEAFGDAGRVYRAGVRHHQAAAAQSMTLPLLASPTATQASRPHASAPAHRRESSRAEYASDVGAVFAP